MVDKVINTIAAFDIDGAKVAQIAGGSPDLDVRSGYRWLHLDLNEPDLKGWVKDHLPEIAARALLQTETRPRCERLADG